MSRVDQPSTPKPEPPYGRNDEQDLELWKHYANFGGEDKNRMVVIASWFLGFSAVILWRVVSELVSPNALMIEEPARATLASVIGIGISFAAAYVSLLYGGTQIKTGKKLMTSPNTGDGKTSVRGWKSRRYVGY